MVWSRNSRDSTAAVATAVTGEYGVAHTYSGPLLSTHVYNTRATTMLLVNDTQKATGEVCVQFATKAISS